MNHFFKTLLALVFIGGVAVAVSYVPIHNVPDISSGADMREVSHYWEGRIAAVGGAHAYEEFKKIYELGNLDQQHTAAHIFGGTLYELEGKNGFSVCDSSFSFGCYHEFLGRAILYEGLPVVLELNEACVEDLKEQALSCQHGIGHGIQTYLGYDFEDLERALVECKELPYNDPIGGCYGGAFMEYNMKTMLSTDGLGPRELSGQLHDPCNKVAREFVPACYYWIPQWWLSNRQEMDLVTAFSFMGGLCMEVEGETVVRECFEGIGNISAQASGYDSVKNIALCTAVSENPLFQLYCRSDAANSHFVALGAEKAGLLCRGLEGDALRYCAAYSRNESNQLNQGFLNRI